MIGRGGSLSSFKSFGSTGSANSLSRNDSYPYHNDLGQPIASGSGLPSADYGMPAMAGNSRMDRYNQRNQRERVYDDIKRQLALHENCESEEEYDEVEEEDRFVNLALLSHIAVRLRDRVSRGTHVKGGIPYQRAFTGNHIQTELLRIARGRPLRDINE